jgi:hypothetical protein
MFGKYFGKKNTDKQEEKILCLEEDISSLKEELESLRVVVKNLYDTINIVTCAQYEIGNDVGMIYKTLKSLSSDSAQDDRLFGFSSTDDDEPYLN